jgi:hypothetical protein
LAPPERGPASDIDDAPETRALHGGEHSLRALDGGAKVDGNHLIETAKINLAEFLKMIEPRIVDQSGNLMARDDIDKRPFDRLGIAHVGDKDFARKPVVAFVAGDPDNTMVFRRQLFSNSAADPAGCAVTSVTRSVTGLDSCASTVSPA